MNLRNALSRVFLVTVLVPCAAGCAHKGNEASSGSNIDGVPVGQVRGGVEISDALRVRLFDDSDNATATFQIERVAGDSIFGLKKHLGAFAQSGTQTDYQNGIPTPFSAALWHQVFASFADAFGNACAGDTTHVTFNTYTTLSDNSGFGFGFGGGGSFSSPKTFTLFPTVATKLAAVCKGDADLDARKKADGAFFDAVMGFGGSLAAERTAFLKTFAEGDAFVKATPKERVSSMLMAILFDPHFLLEK
jgi:hypothetical protein